MSDITKSRKTSQTESLSTLIALAIVMVGWLFFSKGCDRHSSPADPESSRKSGAWVMAQEFVKRGLRSPATADFGGLFEQSSDECVTISSSNEYVVRGWVDSQNGFGATLRTRFYVKIEDQGDSWRMLDIEFTEW